MPIASIAAPLAKSSTRASPANPAVLPACQPTTAPKTRHPRPRTIAALASRADRGECPSNRQAGTAKTHRVSSRPTTTAAPTANAPTIARAARNRGGRVAR